jgi:hypothetical protein
LVENDRPAADCDRSADLESEDKFIVREPLGLQRGAIYADAVGAEEKDIARRMWG